MVAMLNACMLIVITSEKIQGVEGSDIGIFHGTYASSNNISKASWFMCNRMIIIFTTRPLKLESKFYCGRRCKTYGIVHVAKKAYELRHCTQV